MKKQIVEEFEKKRSEEQEFEAEKGETRTERT